MTHLGPRPRTGEDLDTAPRGPGVVDHDGGGPSLLEPLPLKPRH